MSFEEACLRPISGVLDQECIEGHLARLPWVFRDPVDGDVWHMSWSRRQALSREEERLAAPDALPMGVLVWFQGDELMIAQLAGRSVLSRARRFVQWLMTLGSWEVAIDGAKRVALEQLDQLFARVPEPEYFMTEGWLDSGTRIEWWMREQGSGDTQVLSVHTGGYLRYTLRERLLRGRLTSAALTRWRAALEAIDEDEEPKDIAPPEFHISVFVCTPDDEYSLDLDAREMPPSFQVFGGMMMGWMKALAEPGRDSVNGVEGLCPA